MKQETSIKDKLINLQSTLKKLRFRKKLKEQIKLPDLMKWDPPSSKNGLIWEIRKSPIHGKGIFALKNICKDELIDTAFIQTSINEPECSLIRTLFCAYINHSSDSNSELSKHGIIYYLKSTKNINKDEEIVADYNKGHAYKISGGFPNGSEE